MNYFGSKVTRLVDDEVKGLRASLSTARVGPFEVIADASKIVGYNQLIQDFWSPLSNHRIGRFISRYVTSFIGDPDSCEPIGGQVCSPNVFIYTHPDNVDLPGHCYYCFRRALFLRQILLGVNRNIFTKRRIVARTHSFIESAGYWREIGAIYDQSSSPQKER